MATATIVGGDHVLHSLNSTTQSAAVQQALAALGHGFSNGAVRNAQNSTPIPGILNVYNLDPSKGAFTLPGGGQAIVINDKNPTKDVKITGHLGTELLIGNRGDDTVNAAGGNGTVIVGDGNNQIYTNRPSLAGGNLLIQHGTGHDSVYMYGGNATLDQLGKGTGHTSVFAYGGNDSISVASGNTSVYLRNSSNDTLAGSVKVTVGAGTHHILQSSGNDTFTFGSGHDTLSVAGGAATAFGGSGTFFFSGAGGKDSVVAGSGHSTINTGGGRDFLEGGGVFGRATFTGGGAQDTFAFNNQAFGGKWVITDFTQGQDKIHLGGIFQSDSKNGWLNDTHHVTHSGGSTIIHLDPVTTITLNGNFHLTKNDFV